MSALVRTETRANPEWCQRAAEAIVNCYPNGNLPDDETYIRALRTLLASFPRSVAEKVVSMESGVVTKCQFVPTLAEVRAFAEPHLVRLQRAAEFASEQKQIEPPAQETEEGRRAHVEEKLAGWIPIGKAFPKAPAKAPAVQCKSGEAIRRSGLVTLSAEELRERGWKE